MQLQKTGESMEKCGAALQDMVLFVLVSLVSFCASHVCAGESGRAASKTTLHQHGAEVSGAESQ
jgi:hypothetical protein